MRQKGIVMMAQLEQETLNTRLLFSTSHIDTKNIYTNILELTTIKNLSYLKATTMTQGSTVVKIYPTLTKFKLELNAHHRFFCRYYPNAALIFKGPIDIERFLQALNNALNYFPFLFGKLHDDGQTLQILFDQAKKNTESFVLCEIAPDCLQSYLDIQEDIHSYLPQEISPHLYTMPLDVNGFIMIQFRITKCKDGFVLGYLFNHAFLDQASLMYFFKYLSYLYNQQDISELLSPCVLDTFALLKEPYKKSFMNDKAFEENAKTFGRIKEKNTVILLKQDAVSIKLKFNVCSMHAYIQTSTDYCSSNDLINGFLAKIYALQKTSHPFTIEMAANCRPRLELGESTIGNIVSTIKTNDISPTWALSCSPLELAVFIRQHINAFHGGKFLEILNWYYQSSFFSPEKYIAEYLVDPSIIMTSNWAGFDYKTIGLNGSELVALLQAPQAFYHLFLAVITFDNRQNQHFQLEVQIPKSILQPTHQLCEQYSEWVVLEEYK